ncbi:MAG: carbohydrate kinase family protein [Thioalkalivibrionaceae bacterium]
MARILSTGIVTLDHIIDAARFPSEDHEVRGQRWQTRVGGNAANTAQLLARRGHDAWLACCVPTGTSGDDLIEHLNRAGVQVVAERVAGTAPTSMILRTPPAHRTVVHVRDLPEASATVWDTIDTTLVDAFHFEGRNVDVLRALLNRAIQSRIDQPIFLELEKPRVGLIDLAAYADVAMISRAFVTSAEIQHMGWPQAPESFLDAWRQRERSSGRDREWSPIVTLTWGREGAWLDTGKERFHRAPSPDLTIIDAVGAGDAFNAGLIDALISGHPPEQALHRAVRLAEAKLGVDGFDLPPDA